MKIVLCIAIITACVFFGNESLKKTIKRKKYFDAFLAVLTDIGGGLAVSRRSVRELLEVPDGILKDMFEYTKKISSENKTVSLERMLRDFYTENAELHSNIKKDEYAVLMRAFAATEQQNINEIEKIFSETKGFLKEKSEKCGTVDMKKGKLINKVTVLAGLIVVICLI